MRRNSQALAACAVLLALVLVSLLAPWIAPYSPLHADDSLRPPSAAHLLGTDLIGRDTLSRMLYGGQLTFGIALLGLTLAILPGLLIGITAGFRGGLLDQILMTLVDAMLAFPGFLAALAILSVAGQGMLQVALAVGLSAMPSYARVVRASARDVRSRPFIESAHAIGASSSWILTQHVLPNMLRPLIAFATVTFSWLIVNAAMLNFLGFGGDPSAPEWGAMLAAARQTFRLAPWTAIAPGLAIMLTLLSTNLLADAITNRSDY